ncbi:FAD/NAD(P)-binding domain-containing protein [Trichoderma citrinoviride]|uniref:FAD/NAD(P)-binding domain-containing protein n=1 Tax=Trichoderma citrinoviride TaxID=58853 RepID=A0A2T4BH61_9HYPO|nr:FAD/NAD(P)-binding domain-containing protein [Trichoderma citrinoviride]PTB68579.1 FAD/NAD(P)-binding domain-containing protein [Trichoderma citrinoviride]
MDAYAMYPASLSKQASSRIYQDLWESRIHSLVQLASDRSVKTAAAMESFKQRRKSGSNSKPHVGIIGAGLSGLRCADILLQHGFQVTIIEGRDRIGGRLYQERLGNGHLVDMGPNWIHGTDDNPMLDLAKQTGTAVGTWDLTSYVFNESGTLLPVQEGEVYATMVWDIIQDAFVYSNKSSAEIDANLSLLDFFKDKVVEKIPETEQDFQKKRETVLQMSEMWGTFVGSPVGRQSLRFFWLEECIEGENLFCAGTYQKILQEVARPALSNATISYNSVVNKIFSRTKPDDEVRVQLKGGQTLSFDELVVTCPLGWLKRNLTAFDPPLPPVLTKAIGSIGYGSLEKVYISFPKAFWLPAEGDGRRVQGFAQWIAPKYHAENARGWNQEVVELASIAPEAAHPTLLFYIYGEQSDFLTAKVAELESREKKDAFLLDFFKPYYSRLPQYSEDSADCQPVCCLATNWVRDELAGHGSYCNFQVGLTNGDENIKTMRHGLPVQGLWLAGEHTAPFVALGTATGAYWSGESVGKRIAEAYNCGLQVAP